MLPSEKCAYSNKLKLLWEIPTLEIGFENSWYFANYLILWLQYFWLKRHYLRERCKTRQEYQQRIAWRRRTGVTLSPNFLSHHLGSLRRELAGFPEPLKQSNFMGEETYAGRWGYDSPLLTITEDRGGSGDTRGKLSLQGFFSQFI